PSFPPGEESSCRGRNSWRQRSFEDTIHGRNSGALAMQSVIPTGAVGREMTPILEEFFREGCVLVPGIFDPEEIAALRAKSDQFAADESLSTRHRTWSGDTLVLRFCHELDPLFAAATARGSIMALVEGVLGKRPA